MLSPKAMQAQALYAEAYSRGTYRHAAEVAREAKQYRQAILAGAIVGAPAMPEDFE